MPLTAVVDSIAPNVVMVSKQEVAGGGQTPWLFDTSGFPPRWKCGTWTEFLGWLHIISDIAIWSAYMAIPVVLAYFKIKRPARLPVVSWLFIAFIALCGIDHLIDAIIFWHPIYRLAGVWKAVTAVVSWATVIALIPIIPRVLNLPPIEQIDELAAWKRAEDQMNLIVDAAPVGMLMIDKDGRICLANRELERTFGYSHDELIGKLVDDLIPARYRAAHPGHRGSFFACPSARRMGGDRELLGLRKNGTEFPVDVGLTPLNTATGMCALASIVDMTQKRSTELELKTLNLKLEDKNAELEQFLYTASHDLKSPIVTIMGFTSHLISDLQHHRGEDITDHARRIERAAATLRDRVDDLLELSRVGRVTLGRTVIDMQSFTEQIWETVAPEGDPHPQLTTHFEVAQIEMDAGQLTHLLQNFLENAVRYGLESQNKQIEIGTSPAGSEGVLLFVRDHGPGIAAEHRERVFNLFERLSNEKPGTGVGLAIVRRIAALNGGRVWAEETPGGGATFWIELANANPARDQVAKAEVSQ